MVEPVTTLTAAAVLTYVVPKLLDASLGKVGETLTEGTIAKIQQTVAQLRAKIWERLRRHFKAEQAFLGAEAGSEDDLQTITTYLQGIFDRDPQFRQELQPLVQEIEQTINIAAPNARNIQQVSGGQGLQVNDPQAPVIQAGESAQFTFNYGLPKT